MSDIKKSPVKKRGLKALPWKSILTSAAIALFTLFLFSGYGQAYLAPNVLKGDHAKIGMTCSDCHTPFSGVKDLSCQMCHKGIAQAQILKKGLHASAVGKCNSCHSMHAGEKDGLLVSAFDHGKQNFTLDKHRKQTCKGCHGNDFRADASDRCDSCHLKTSKKISKKETRTYAAHIKGLKEALTVQEKNRTSASENDIRKAVTRDLRCDNCHRGAVRITYRHADAGFALTVTRVGAADAKITTRAITGATSDAAVRDFFVGEHKKTTCKGCHSNQEFLRDRGACRDCHGQNQPHGIIKTECSSCHSSKAWEPAKNTHTPKLLGAHAKVDCKKCHAVKKGDLSGKSVATLAAPWRCTGCHKPTHKKQYSGACLNCHDQSDWKNVRVTHSAKAACAGCHSAPARHFQGACQSCHGSTKSWAAATVRHTAASRCTDCHSRPRGHFSGSCTQCHRMSGSWKAATFKHSSGRCASCHWKPRGHFAGSCSQCHSVARAWRSATFRHSSSSFCSNCHSRPRGHYSGTCNKCHSSTKSWRSATFSHPRVREHSWRSFACSSCHPKGTSSYSCTRCHGANGEDDDDEKEDKKSDEEEDDD